MDTGPRMRTCSPLAGSAPPMAVLLAPPLLPLRSPSGLLVALLVEILRKMKSVAALTLLASASAFSPAQTGSRVREEYCPLTPVPLVTRNKVERWKVRCSSLDGPESGSG